MWFQQSNEPVEEKHCEYEKMENDIHRLIILKATKHSVDEYLEYLGEIIQAHEGNEPILLLTDLRSGGVPPVTHVYSAAKKFFDEVGRPSLRAAYIHNSNAFIKLGQTFLRLLELNSTREFFEGDNAEEEAIAWLLE